MCHSLHRSCAKCQYLPHRWPGPVWSRPHQRALRKRGRRDQQHGAERRLLCRRVRAALPRHSSREPLRSPSVAFLYHLSAGSHPTPQQPGLWDGQSGGAGWTRWCGTGPEGNGRRSNVRSFHRQQYGIPRLSHQPRLMAGRDGPLPVLSQEDGWRSAWGHDWTDAEGFLHFYRSPRQVLVW